MVHRGLYCKTVCRKTQEKVMRTEEEVWNGELLALLRAYIGNWKRLTGKSRWRREMELLGKDHTQISG